MMFGEFVEYPGLDPNEACFLESVWKQNVHRCMLAHSELSRRVLEKVFPDDVARMICEHNVEKRVVVTLQTTPNGFLVWLQKQNSDDQV